MMMVKSKYFLIFLMCLSFYLDAAAQGREELSLEEAYQLLENRYPALKNATILKEIHAKNLESIEKDKLPNLYLKADSRIQTESAHLDLPPEPAFPINIDVPLYSAKTYIEAQYTLIDGGKRDIQKNLSKINLQADLQTVEVNKYALRDHLNQLFLGIIIQRELYKLFEISLLDLNLRKERIEAGISEGVVLESELSQLEVQELELLAQKENIKFVEAGLVTSLSDILDIELSEKVDLNLPTLGSLDNIPEIKRPEQELFRLKQEAILAQSDLIDLSEKPYLSAFAQAGMGYPNPLNFLEDKFAPYAMLGLHFQWKLTDWEKNKIEKEKLSLQVMRLQNEKETFDFNLDVKEANYKTEVSRLRNQLNYDSKIAALQKEILTTLSVQLDEGIITSSDYVVQFNKELRARQKILIHQTELIKTQINFWNERGGFTIN
jgi:hypothetical protein